MQVIISLFIICLIIAHLFIDSSWEYDFLFSSIFYIAIFIILSAIFRKKDNERKKRIEKIRKNRKEELSDIDNIDNMDGIVFERYIGKLLKHKGYSVEYTPVTDDKGVDIIATRDNIRCAIQIKRYSSTVSRTAVSDAVGGKYYYHCDIPMVITNNYFTKAAKEFAKATRCKLIDRDELTNWITDFQNSKKT